MSRSQGELIGSYFKILMFFVNIQLDFVNHHTNLYLIGMEIKWLHL